MRLEPIEVEFDPGENPMLILHLPNGRQLYIDHDHMNYNYDTLYEFLTPQIEAHERLVKDLSDLRADSPATPVTAQTGQRQRFRNPIQANKTAAGKIEADYGDYTAIEQRILTATSNKTLAQSNRALLLEERVFILERGERKAYPSPMELYSGDALFREFVDQCILWQQQNAQNSSSRVNVSAVVKTICNYIRPNSGWLAWEKKRRLSNEPLPVSAEKPVKVEVIQPRGTPTSQG